MLGGDNLTMDWDPIQGWKDEVLFPITSCQPVPVGAYAVSL